MYSNFIASLNNCILKKKYCFHYKFSKKLVKFLHFLIKERFIRNYNVLGIKNLVKIQLSTRSGKSIIKGVVFLKKNNPNIKHKKIPVNSSFILVISTNRGLITNAEARKFNIGGKVFCKILC